MKIHVVELALACLLLPTWGAAQDAAAKVREMLATGESKAAVAARLGISGHTVKFHVASVLGKLSASSRTEAVTIGLREGLIMI